MKEKQAKLPGPDGPIATAAEDWQPNRSSIITRED